MDDSRHEQSMRSGSFGEGYAALQSLLENTDDYVLLSDHRARPVFFNQAYARVMKRALGIDMRKGLQPHTLLDDPDMVAFWDGLHARVLAGEQFKQQFHFNFPDGEDLHLEISFNPIVEDGKVVGFSEFSKDITEFKRTEEALRQLTQELEQRVEARTSELLELNQRLQTSMEERLIAEQALRASETKLRQVIEHSSNLFYVHDVNHVLSFVSPQVRDFLECEPEEAMVKWTEFATDHPLNERGFALTERAIATGQRQDPYVLELVGCKKRRIWVEIHESPVLVDGKTHAIVGAASNITERRRAEEALKDSEAKYRLLVEHAADGIVITQDERICFANPGFVRLVGQELRHIKGQPFAPWIHPEDRRMVIRRHMRRLQGEKLSRITTFRGVRPDGQVVWLQMASDLVNWEGRKAVLSFLRDVTLERELSLQLQNTQKMEAIGTLAGGVAHDFNNLLMGIMGRVSLMKAHVQPDSALWDHLSAVEKHVESAGGLTRQLLGFARGGKFQVVALDINHLVRETTQWFGRTRKEVRIHLDLASSLPLVDADSKQLEQVLLNLFVNAWHAMESGGDLFISTCCQDLSEDEVVSDQAEAGRYVRVSVRDTGVGMDEQTAHRVFEPFFTTRVMGRGSGLGLASAYGIVRNHRGWIQVESELGRGSEFQVFLPASDAEHVPVPAKTDKTLRGHETILIVDDEPIILEVLQPMLEMLGYDVVTASSGNQALHRFRVQEPPFDLVILDQIMPGMSGRDTYLKLKAIHADVKVLVASGYGPDGEGGDLLELGCVGFIQKPFDLNALGRKIRQILANTDP